MGQSTFEYPVLPIKNTVVFPSMTVPIRVGRKLSLSGLNYAAKSSQDWIVTIAQKVVTDETSDPAFHDMNMVGTLCKIEQKREVPDRGFQVWARGVSRFKVTAFRVDDTSGAWIATGELESDLDDLDQAGKTALLASLKETGKEILSLLPGDTEALQKIIDGVEDLSYLTALCAANVELSTEQKQSFLENKSLKSRTLWLLEILNGQRENLKIQGEIREKLSSRLGKHQRDAILREHLKTIKDELGEDDPEDPIQVIKSKLETLKLPDEVRKSATQELRRLEGMGSNSPESHMIRNYLELVVALPWEPDPQVDIDLKASREILDSDHEGMEKVKKRIIAHLALMKLGGAKKGSILCLVGPPGVGKTSLGQSVAKALGRKFIRVALGGVRDDAEIRGHRRTYIGAMPGRIIQNIRRAQSMNPVILLDEIDKLSHSYHGDPAAALLEVLDPEQNKAFVDHFLDVPYDLSQAVFVATANSLEGIPPALLDRLEVIQLSGYTVSEKEFIASKHLLPKVLKDHSITPEQFELSSEVITALITGYTREAGVRNLQRKIQELLFGFAEAIASGPKKVELSDLEEVLGPRKHMSEEAQEVNPPGVVTGLAWTPVGGEILFIETLVLEGSGKLQITGQLGDVMKESAQLALSLVKERWPRALVWDKVDMHIHVPSGAVPKDGPSAGIALFLSIASAVLNESVNSKLAFSGEITLRGRVTPVGGIKEKLLAAERAGITKVFLSKKNLPDLHDVPREVKNSLEIDWVEDVDALIAAALPTLPALKQPRLNLRDSRAAIGLA